MLRRYKLLDDCPCPRSVYPLAAEIQHRIGKGVIFTSIYRGDDVAGLLHRHGKHTQRELYDGYRRGLPGYLPANPPDRGTHILRGDGVVGRLFARLRPWQVGFDVNEELISTDEVIAEGHRLGVEFYRPYPSGSEHHHLNLRRAPSRALLRRLKRAQRRRRRHH